MSFVVRSRAVSYADGAAERKDRARLKVIATIAAENAARSENDEARKRLQRRTQSSPRLSPRPPCTSRLSPRFSCSSSSHRILLRSKSWRYEVSTDIDRAYAAVIIQALVRGALLRLRVKRRAGSHWTRAQTSRGEPSEASTTSAIMTQDTPAAAPRDGPLPALKCAVDDVSTSAHTPASLRCRDPTDVVAADSCTPTDALRLPWRRDFLSLLHKKTGQIPVVPVRGVSGSESSRCSRRSAARLQSAAIVVIVGDSASSVSTG